MKKPTLEEVREHFKDAKVVKSLFNGNIYKGRLDVNDFHWWNNGIWCQTENLQYHLHVWCPEKGYAEIVEYKDEIHPGTFTKSIQEHHLNTHKQMETNQNNTEFQLSFETVGGVDVILTGQNLDNLTTIANMIK